MSGVVTENLVRCLDQPQCAALVTPRAPNNDALGGRCVPRMGKRLVVVVIGQKKALHAQTQKPLSSLWKVTRSISPDISSVAGLRSESAAFMGRRPFCHGQRLASVPIRKLILRGFGCGGELCVGSGVSQVNEGFGAKLITDCGTAANRG